jgi:HAD superfamily hydrolase (TIGR01509 family)
MHLAAIIFDFDGTIADTERDGHRVAYNAAFEELGLDVRWDEATYGRLLATAGGKERLERYFERERPEIAAGERRALAARVHETKRRLFAPIADRLPFRPGIARLLEEIRAAGDVRAAIATTAAPDGVHALLRRDPELARTFVAIGAGDVVAHKKPAPDIYAWTLAALGCEPAAALAIEDSHIGLRAARAAGLTTLVTPSTYTRDEDFAGAASVVSDLGEPDAPARALAGPPLPRGYVDLAYLRALHARARSAA